MEYHLDTHDSTSYEPDYDMIKYRPMEQSTWQDQYNSELDQAKAARAFGNEGKARVCARRAVGIVIGEYMRREQIFYPNASAYDRIKFLNSLESLTPEIRGVLEHFLLRIDTDHNLPIDADLIGEARWLSETLLHTASVTDRADD